MNQELLDVIKKLKTKTFKTMDINKRFKDIPYKTTYTRLVSISKGGLIKKEKPGVWRIDKRKLSENKKKTIPDANTLEIIPKFASIYGWKKSDLKKLGFDLVDVKITAQGSIDPNKKSQYRKISEQVKTSPNGKKHFVMDRWTHRRYDKLEPTTIKGVDFNWVRDLIVVDHPNATFKIDKIHLNDSEGRQITVVKKSNRGFSNRMVVFKIDDKKFDEFTITELVMIMGELFYAECVWENPPKKNFHCESDYIVREQENKLALKNIKK